MLRVTRPLRVSLAQARPAPPVVQPRGEPMHLRSNGDVMSTAALAIAQPG